MHRATRRILSVTLAVSAVIGPLALDAYAKKNDKKKTEKVASLNPAPVKSNSKLVTPPPSKPYGPKAGCPAGMAGIPTELGGFCIDRYEAALVDVLPNGKTKSHSPFTPVNGTKVKAVSKKGITPQGYISKNEANDACEAAGKRLCTPDEWMKACQGKSPTKYPYGDDEVAGRCNGDGTRKHPISELFGASADAFADSTKMNDPRINQLPDTVAKTGSHAKCKNSYGVYDMVGNLHEWTADPSGQFKGGYYMDTHKNGDGCFYRTTAHGTSYHDYSTGFRCCK